MSQKAVSEFFLSRKRQRPGSLKEGPTKSILPEGQDEPVRKAKRMKKDAGSICETSSNETGVKLHKNKEQILMSLKARHGMDSPAKPDTRRTHLDKLQDKLAGFKTATENMNRFEASSKFAAEKKSDSAPSVESFRIGHVSTDLEKKSLKSLATPRSVQRNLFGDDDKKTRHEGAKPVSAETRRTVPPEMSPQKMKESLMHCSKISQLKERLAGYNNAAQKLKEFQDSSKAVSAKDQISKAKSTLEFEITSPVKTPKKSIASPSPKKTPAYQRFQHLLSEAPSTLTLPYKFRFLKEAFHCLDTVSSFLHNRKEIITFKKLKSSVQEMLNKNFTEKQLAQIKTVFPFAYIYRREKNLPNHKVTPNNKNKWQLTVEVNINYETGKSDGVNGYY